MSTLQSSLHIVLIEDSDDDAYFFTRLLKKSNWPHRYTHLSDGRAGLSYLAECLAPGAQENHGSPPDLVFVDLKLPVVTGFEIIEWLSQQKPKPAFDVVILSGSDQASDVARAASLGVAGYFVKPLQLAQLQSRLEHWQNPSETKSRGHRAGVE